MLAATTDALAGRVRAERAECGVRVGLVIDEDVQFGAIDVERLVVFVLIELVLGDQDVLSDLRVGRAVVALPGRGRPSGLVGRCPGGGGRRVGGVVTEVVVAEVVVRVLVDDGDDGGHLFCSDVLDQPARSDAARSA